MFSELIGGKVLRDSKEPAGKGLAALFAGSISLQSQVPVKLLDPGCEDLFSGAFGAAAVQDKGPGRADESGDKARLRPLLADLLNQLLKLA